MRCFLRTVMPSERGGLLLIVVYSLVCITLFTAMFAETSSKRSEAFWGA